MYFTVTRVEQWDLLTVGTFLVARDAFCCHSDIGKGR